MSDKIKRDLEATRNALLNSTAKLMTDCSEPSEVTSRAIAKESGVNLAIIALVHERVCFMRCFESFCQMFRNTIRNL